jgi:hypothetical protein
MKYKVQLLRTIDGETHHYESEPFDVLPENPSQEWMAKQFGLQSSEIMPDADKYSIITICPE